MRPWAARQRSPAEVTRASIASAATSARTASPESETTRRPAWMTSSVPPTISTDIPCASRASVIDDRPKRFAVRRERIVCTAAGCDAHLEHGLLDADRRRTGGPGEQGGERKLDLERGGATSERGIANG